MTTPDTAESRLAQTLFIVEADSYAYHSLWADHAEHSLWTSFDVRENRRSHKARTWEQINPGWLIEVGKLGRMPCCISVSWARIDGHLVMFWYECSQVTDSRKAEAWLAERFKGTYDGGHRRASCDASNFVHCLSAIDEANAS